MWTSEHGESRGATRRAHLAYGFSRPEGTHAEIKKAHGTHTPEQFASREHRLLIRKIMVKQHLELEVAPKDCSKDLGRARHVSVAAMRLGHLDAVSMLDLRSVYWLIAAKL